MLHTVRTRRGMVTAPHHLAARSGLRVLEEGGNALEAMIAMAATVAVAYPHMNGLGGDGFWLVAPPDGAPTAIRACGPAADLASPDWYADHGIVDALPRRGPLAALTVAGTVDGWRLAGEMAAARGGRLPLTRLLEDAIHHAAAGVAVGRDEAHLIADTRDEFTEVPGFADRFLNGAGVPLGVGEMVAAPALAETLRRLAEAGLDDFYRGDVAASLVADLDTVGSPLRAEDFAAYRAAEVTPIHLDTRWGRVFNLPSPTQGVASLIMLGLLERADVAAPEDAVYVHWMVEVAKLALAVRDRVVTDPLYETQAPGAYLTPTALDDLAARIDPRAAQFGDPLGPESDTIWMGAVDGAGLGVSFIQSLFNEFGSGVVLPGTGLVWQNRGTAFKLAPQALNVLAPGRLPPHTLNPAYAALSDGRRLVYGTMGGQGQPQFQTQVFARHVVFGAELQAAVTAPRWLWGETWGAPSPTLKLERRFGPGLTEALARLGHPVELRADFDHSFGHAGAVAIRADGVLEGAADPRADGAAMGF